MPPADSPNERRIRIADAALRLLAHDGAKGLTHRAVDAELALPNGSTSYYFRTRAALLLTAAERLLALDAADAQHIAPDAAGLASLLSRWVSPAGRTRSLARMELLLLAARDPGLEFIVDARQQFIAYAEAAMHKHAKTRGHTLSAARARTQATSLVALMDGLTMHGLVTGTLSAVTAQRIFEQHIGSAREAKKKKR